MNAQVWRGLHAALHSWHAGMLGRTVLAKVHSGIAVPPNASGHDNGFRQALRFHVRDSPGETGLDVNRPQPCSSITVGTGGDVRARCVLGQALTARGHDVRLVTTRHPPGRIRRFGLEPVEAGDGFTDDLNDPRFGPFSGPMSLPCSGTCAAHPTIGSPRRSR